MYEYIRACVGRKPTFASGESGEVEELADRIPAVSVPGLDVELVGRGRRQLAQSDALVVPHLVYGLCPGGGHDHLLPDGRCHHAGVKLPARTKTSRHGLELGQRFCANKSKHDKTYIPQARRTAVK